MNHKKLLNSLVLLTASLFLGGCSLDDIQINNLTPSTLAENNSNVYTITTAVKPKATNVVRDSIEMNIVIDGETFPMERSSLSSDLFEFDYHLPAGRQDASYYFLADYKVDVNGFIKSREAFSEIHSFTLTNRYAYSLDVTRAPVGSNVGVVGRGFKSSDVIKIGDMEAPTEFNSANSLNFNVPSIRAGQSYMVQLSDGESTLNVGTLRVDAGTINVSPSSISLNEGERAMLVFSVNSRAPRGGLTIDVTTDIPDSVVMPEVVVPEGSRSVNVPFEAGEAGEGNLYIEMDGYDDVTIPVTIR